MPSTRCHPAEQQQQRGAANSPPASASSSASTSSSSSRLHFPTGQQSIYQVARELRREQHTLFNCLASILADAAFIQEIRLLYPDLPLLANLRAGGWYAPSPDGTCYFKSTDGHQNNCNFSTTRLNWHVAELAAQKGGLMVVDATRKGKRFPDALSKTIPIWAAVLNRAVARVRAYDEQKAQRRRTYAAADGDVFTAVTDTQTTISVRSNSEAGTASPATHQQQQQLEQPEQLAQDQQRAGNRPPQQHYQQQQQPALEQPQGLLHQQGVGPQQNVASSQQQCDSAQVQELLVDCMGPSVDLMSGLSSVPAAAHSSCSATGAHTAAHMDPSSSPAAVSTPEPCSTSSSSSAALPLVAGAVVAAAAAGGGGGVPSCLGPPCCCLHRSKSVHISPQPSLHEWLDEMDVLRRLTLLADSRACMRAAPRVSCPAGCGCLPSKAADQGSSGAPIVPLPAARVAAVAAAAAAASHCAGSAPAVSCLRASAESDDAPPTPSALGCPRAQFVVRDVSAFEVADRAAAAAAAASSGKAVVGSRPASPLSPVSITAAARAAGSCSSGPGSPSAGLWPAAAAASSKAAVPALDGLGPPAFLLSTGGHMGPGGGGSADEESAGEPVTPRLMRGGSTAANNTTTSSSSRSSSGEVMTQAEEEAAAAVPAVVPVFKQLRFDAAEQDGSGSDSNSNERLPAEFAFPSPHQLAASAGSSLGADTAGHLASSGLASSSGNSCGSELVRLPDMPVVVLNGTSHQPGDAASILEIWRGTDLEDVACLPGISDFSPGVYHMPQQQQQDARLIDEAGWPSVQQQQQPGDGAAGAAGDNSSSSNTRGTVSWAAEVCLRSQQQLSGRVSVSNWLDDDETGAACDALQCAFAVPALAPSCCSTNSSSDTTEEAAAAAASCCSGAACGGSQGSGSVCSEEDDDDRPSSRQSSGTAGCSSSGATAAAAPAACPAVEWDTALHLPLWVSSHEREVIEAKLDGWVERLLEVGADVRGLAAVLTKPLRPLWVSQSSLIWTNQVAHPSTLPFIPLLLVSASQPHAGERQAVKAAWLKLAKGYGTASAGVGSPSRPLTPAMDALVPAGCSDGSSDCSSDDEEEGAGWDELEVGCSWGSSRSAGGGGGRKGSKGGPVRKAGGRAQPKRTTSKSDLAGLSYVYVPGAGDDEESWAAGLTPALFWQHCDALLRCGPHNIRPAVKQLLQLHKSACYGGAAASLAATAVRGLAATPNSSSGRPLSPLGQGSSCGTGRPAVLTDKHHQAPRGAREGVSLHVVPAAPGAFWVGNTGLAVGNLEGASAADVWRAVDAVLCCGTAMVPVLQGEYQAMRLAAARVPATPVPTTVSSSAPSASTWVLQQRQQARQKQQQQQSKQQQAAAGDRQLSSSFCTGGSAVAHSHWLRQQQQLAGVDAGAPDSSCCPAAAQLEFSKVGGSASASAAARKPVRKSGMLSALLSKAGTSAQAALDSTSTGAGAGVAAAPAAAADIGVDAVGSLGGDSEGSSVCSSSYFSVCSEDDGAATTPAHSSSTSKGVPALPRLKWLPVVSAKKDRSSLKQHLQEALEFVSAHLAAGHTVLLHDVEGHDNCVCLAVAVLSGCFDTPATATSNINSSDVAEPSFAGAWLPSRLQEQEGEQQQQQEEADGEAQPQGHQQVPPAPVSKQSVRQQLALVSGCYPLARPTRSMLKQVYNFFEERRRA